MKTENYKKLAEDLIKYATQKGASQIQVSISTGRDFSLDVRQQEIENLLEAGSAGISLKVFVDKKVAAASSSDLNERTLHSLIDNAIKRAALSSYDEFAVLPENESLKVNIDSLKLYDPAFESISTEKKIEIAMELESIGVKDKRINQSLGSSFNTNIGETIIANSNGFYGSYKYTQFGVGAYFQTGSGNNMYEDGWSEFAHDFKSLPDTETIAKKGVERAARMINSRKIESQNVPVIVEQPLVSRILGMVSQCVMGSSIYMNQSFLVNKIEQKVAHENITIIDDGLIPGGRGSKPFDAEGVPTRKTTIIDKGILKSYLLGTYSGLKLGMKSTGNVSGPNNFYMLPGKHTPEEIIKSVDKGLLLTGTIGQGFAQTTGNLSTGAYGIWIEKGELTYPVSEITVSNNLGKMLESIEMIGNDLVFNRPVTGPTIKIPEMTISGK